MAHLFVLEKDEAAERAAGLGVHAGENFRRRHRKHEGENGARRNDGRAGGIPAVGKNGSHRLPSVKTVLIDERDFYLAAKIYEADGRNLIAVVGAGHVPGILKNLELFEAGEKPTDVSSVDFVPEKRFSEKAVPWILPGIIIAVFIGGFFIAGTREQTLEKLIQWILISGSLAAAGSFVTAPITTLNPFIGVGMVTGLSEAVLRKPRVGDFNRLNDDIASLKGFYRNRVTRIFLVFLGLACAAFRQHYQGNCGFFAGICLK